jgi:hypothetical protein
VQRVLTAVVLGAILCSATSGTAIADPPPLPGVAAVGCPSVPATEPAHATVPPELQMLEQKLQHVKLNSLRISYQLAFASPSGTESFHDITDGNVSTDESTSILTIRGRSSSGKPESEVGRILEIGDSIYRYEPNFTHGDGGRPWVREHRERSRPGSKSTSLEPTIKQLGEAESILEGGTAEIDSQQVSQFTATFAPGVYPRSDLPFGELFEKACPTPVQVDLALAPSGLPVRVDVNANYSSSNEAVSSTSTTEILATNFPFPALKPPPTKRTISAAVLQRFHSAQLNKELKKLKKRRKHGAARNIAQ